jgi:Inactive DUF488-N3 subclade
VIQTKRVYEPAARTDGRRYLAERLWPRGIKKVKAAHRNLLFHRTDSGPAQAEEALGGVGGKGHLNLEGVV